MIKEEKLSIKKAKKRVKNNLEKLLASNRQIKDIFDISFSRKNFTLFNLTKWNTLTEITYKEGYDKVILFASYFSKNIDKSEKYVGLLLENSPEWVYSLYGLLMAGFVPILLSTKANNDETLDVLNTLNSNVVITNFNIEKKTINPFEIKENIPDFEENWANKIVFITSGTSGKSKIILYTGEELTEQIINATGILKNYPSIASTYNGYLKHLVILPFYHVFGFIAVFLWFSFFNISFVIPHSLSSEHIREACMIGEPTHIFAVPLFWDTIVKKVEFVVKNKKAEDKFNKGINASLKIQSIFKNKGPNIVKNKLFASYLDNIFGKSIQFCITGGSYISENTLRVINGLGYPLVNGFGSTEIGISSFSSPKKIQTRLSNSIGLPFDNFKYELGNDNELLVKGLSTYNSMFLNGSWVKREKGEYVHTADSAKVIDSKYYITGRMDEIFVDINGENYSLPLVEKMFKTTFATDVVVLPLKNEKSLAILLSFDEKASEYQVNYDLLKVIKNENFVKNNIKSIFILKREVPKANGLKVKRKYLLDLVENGKEVIKVDLNKIKEDMSNVVLDTNILNVVLDKFSVITNINNVNKDSDFFVDLGGDSLSYHELVLNLESYFGIKFNFEEGVNRTPSQFAVAIMEKM